MSTRVTLSREMELSDLNMHGSYIERLIELEFDPCYEIDAWVYPGQAAILNALPENCCPEEPSTSESAEDPFLVACAMLEKVKTEFTLPVLYKMVNAFEQWIRDDCDSDQFKEYAIEQAELNCEPDDYERDED